MVDLPALAHAPEQADLTRNVVVSGASTSVQQGTTRAEALDERARFKAGLVASALERSALASAVKAQEAVIALASEAIGTAAVAAGAGCAAAGRSEGGIGDCVGSGFDGQHHDASQIDNYQSPP